MPDQNAIDWKKYDTHVVDSLDERISVYATQHSRQKNMRTVSGTQRSRMPACLSMQCSLNATWISECSIYLALFPLMVVSFLEVGRRARAQLAATKYFFFTGTFRGRENKMPKRGQTSIAVVYTYSFLARSVSFRSGGR